MPPWGSASAAGAAGGERAGPAAGRGLSHRPAAPRAQGKRGKGRPGCRSSTLGLRRLFGPTVVRRGTNTAEKQLSPALESPLPRRAPSRGRGAEARARRSLRPSVPPSVRPSVGSVRAQLPRALTRSPSAQDPRPPSRARWRRGRPGAASRPPPLLTLVAMALPARAALPLCPPPCLPASLRAAAARSLGRLVCPARPLPPLGRAGGSSSASPAAAAASWGPLCSSAAERRHWAGGG